MNEPIKFDGNKVYFESPWNKHPNIVGVGKEVIGFGKMLPEGGEQFIHFKKKQWKWIKKFIDEELSKEVAKNDSN